MRKLSLVFSCIFVSSLWLGGTAAAEISLVAPSLQSAVGGSAKLFSKQQKASLEKELETALERTSDPVLRDALKRDFEERVASISAAQISLDGPSPYDSSILAGEFRSGAGDSMLQQQSSNGKTVFFFNGARLWKTFQELPASADKDSLVAELSERFGEPRLRTTPEGYDSQVWVVENRELTLADRVAEYGCLTFSVADAEVAEARRMTAVNTKKKRSLNPLLSSVLSAEEDDSISNVVDDLLGGQTAATR